MRVRPSTRSAWLLAQPKSYIIQSRQQLEELESKGESPLLTPKEAINLMSRADRSAGVLSHGWLSPGNVRAQRTPNALDRSCPGGATLARATD